MEAELQEAKNGVYEAKNGVYERIERLEAELQEARKGDSENERLWAQRFKAEEAKVDETRRNAREAEQSSLERVRGLEEELQAARLAIGEHVRKQQEREEDWERERQKDRRDRARVVEDLQEKLKKSGESVRTVWLSLAQVQGRAHDQTQTQTYKGFKLSAVGRGGEGGWVGTVSTISEGNEASGNGDGKMDLEGDCACVVEHGGGLQPVEGRMMEQEATREREKERREWEVTKMSLQGDILRLQRELTLVQEEGACARDDESVRGASVLQQTSTELLLLQREEELEILRKMRDDAQQEAAQLKQTLLATQQHPAQGESETPRRVHELAYDLAQGVSGETPRMQARVHELEGEMEMMQTELTRERLLRAQCGNRVDALERTLDELNGKLAQEIGAKSALQLRGIDLQHQVMELERKMLVQADEAQQKLKQVEELEEELLLHRRQEASEVAAKEVLRQMVEALQERVVELEGEVEGAKTERARVWHEVAEARDARDRAREDAMARQIEVEAVWKEMAVEREAKKMEEEKRQRELVLFEAERGQVEALKRDLMCKESDLRHSRQVMEEMQHFVADRDLMHAGIEEVKAVADGLREELRIKQKQLDQAQKKLNETKKMAESVKNEWDWRVTDFEMRQREWEREGELWAERQREWQREREAWLVEKSQWVGEKSGWEGEKREWEREKGEWEGERQRMKAQAVERQKKRKFDGVHCSGPESSIGTGREGKQMDGIGAEGPDVTWGSGHWKAFVSKDIESCDCGDGAWAGASGGEHEANVNEVLDMERDGSVNESFSSSSLDGSMLARLLGEGGGGYEDTHTPAVHEMRTEMRTYGADTHQQTPTQSKEVRGATSPRQQQVLTSLCWLPLASPLKLESSLFDPQRSAGRRGAEPAPRERELRQMLREARAEMEFLQRKQQEQELERQLGKCFSKVSLY